MRSASPSMSWLGRVANGVWRRAAERRRCRTSPGDGPAARSLPQLRRRRRRLRAAAPAGRAVDVSWTCPAGRVEEASSGGEAPRGWREGRGRRLLRLLLPRCRGGAEGRIAPPSPAAEPATHPSRSQSTDWRRLPAARGRAPGRPCSRSPPRWSPDRGTCRGHVLHTPPTLASPPPRLRHAAALRGPHPRAARHRLYQLCDEGGA